MSWKPAGPVNPWIVTIVISLATFMEVLDTSIANVSLSHIAGGLGAGLDESTWVLTTYLVANAVMMPISGWLGTVLGLKRLYLICVATFTASSLLCGLAPSMEWLLVFRVLQGVGGAGMAPVVQAMLADIFPPEKRGLAFAVYGLSVVFAPAIGPTLGGWITDNYSWHWIFLINVPVGIISVFLTSILVSEPAATTAERERLHREGFSVDWLGFILCVVGIGALEFFVDRGQREDWFSSPLIVTMAITSAVCITSLIIWEVRCKMPMVDVSLFKIPSFAASFICMFFIGFVLFGSTALLPQFLEQLMGYTAQQAGMALTAGGIALIFLMPFVGGVIVPRVATRKLVIAGLVLQAAALWHMTSFSLQITFDQAVMARVFQVAGMSLLFIPITRAAYDNIPPGKNNGASALINLARNLGGSVGIALSSTVLAQRAQFHQTRLVENVSDYDTESHDFLQRIADMMASQGSAMVDAQQKALQYAYQEVLRQASMLSYIDVFMLMAIATLMIIPVAFLLSNKLQAPKGAPPAH